ncbi:MAG: hypothetical protein BMS9Abin20_1089 [Acidimicrobiia bacterium]|nr:MAG: hypothetical protein BMS9Abin20_1089 [Acidimicrobiia bacterium]
MRQFVGIAAAWLAATLVAVAIAAAAVGSVRNEVADTPTALGVEATQVEATQAVDIENPVTAAVAEPQEATAEADKPATEPDVTLTEADEPATEPDVTITEADEPAAEPDNDPPGTTTTTKPHDDEDESDDSTTTSTEPQPTTTTAVSYTKTYDVGDAGTVTIKVSGESVTFASAVPKGGWTFKLKDAGPEAVEVRFERNDDDEGKIEFKAEIDDGELEVSISEDD